MIPSTPMLGMINRPKAAMPAPSTRKAMMSIKSCKDVSVMLLRLVRQLFASATSSASALPAAGVFDPEAAHGLGRGGEEGAAAVPVRLPALSDQPQPGFVDAGGGVEGLARRLLRQLRGGEPARLAVDEGQEPPGGVRVALLDGR